MRGENAAFAAADRRFNIISSASINSLFEFVASINILLKFLSFPFTACPTLSNYAIQSLAFPVHLFESKSHFRL